MRINIITEDREKYMDILLLADPQEDMILKYLHQSDLFVLSEEGVIKTVCAVVRLNDRACEIKNMCVNITAAGFRRYSWEQAIRRILWASMKSVDFRCRIL